jgi:murein tripeptide amidase MpaA
MLRNTKFHFIPIVNVDGAALVEEGWKTDHKILNKRKNMNPGNSGTCGEENQGVDLNRNYGVNWEPERIKNRTELCGDFWPGEEAFSEPESRAMRDFISKNRGEIKFVINCHTSGNDFIWPYNAKAPNDINERNPGYLAIF